MNISATIEFKSIKSNYVKEQSGIKPNTVRVLNPEEQASFKFIWEQINYIKITYSPYNGQCFVRRLIDITEFEIEELKPNMLYIFSWRQL